jgi:molybdopterin-guanine dinucleotide biosynthesis protein A
MSRTFQDPTDQKNLPNVPRTEVTGVILAGGKGRRMGGEDKGLLLVDGRPLIRHIIDAVLPQVGCLLINANRNLESYRTLGHPVIRDILGEYLGPLAGVASAMQASYTPYLLILPCDSPLVPSNLCTRLYRELKATGAHISAAHDGNRMQQVFALLRRELLPDLLTYLESGGRKIDTWYGEHRLVLSDFSDKPDAFLNINELEDLRALTTAKRGTDSQCAGSG